MDCVGWLAISAVSVLGVVAVLVWGDYRLGPATLVERQVIVHATAHWELVNQVCHGPA